MQLSRILLIAFAAAAAAVVVWLGFESTTRNHLAASGRIGRVRTQKIEENVAVAVLDFKIRNDSDQKMIVRSVRAQVQMPDGITVDGVNASESDAPRLFQAYPALGEQFNPVLKERDVIPPHGELDRMVTARFDIPWEQMENRKGIEFAVEDNSGSTLKLEAKRGRGKE